MIVKIAFGQYLAQASAKAFTIPALTLKRSSRVMPGKNYTHYNTESSFFEFGQEVKYWT